MTQYPTTHRSRRRRRAADEAATPVAQCEEAVASPARSLETLRNPALGAAERGRAAIGLQGVVGNAAVGRELVRRETTTTKSGIKRQMIEELERSALGRKALAIWKKYNVPLKITDSGMPAGYDPENDTCTINGSMLPAEIAAYFVHEMHHANQFHLGRSDLAKNYKDDEEEKYVQHMVDEEIAGTYLQLETALEMGSDFSQGSNMMRDSVLEYKRVRNDWYNKHLRDNPGDKEGATKLSKQIGRAIVANWIRGDEKDNFPPILMPPRFSSYEAKYRMEFRQSRKKDKESE